MNPYEAPSLELIKFFKKQNVKSKETILQTARGNVRTSMFRTDVMKDSLDEIAYKKIQDIYKGVWNEPIGSFEDFTKLINALLSNHIMLKLDRAPQKIRGPLYKWPKQMQLAEVR